MKSHSKSLKPVIIVIKIAIESCENFIQIAIKNTLWLFNIAMENGPFTDGLASKMMIFHGYVK